MTLENKPQQFSLSIAKRFINLFAGPMRAYGTYRISGQEASGKDVPVDIVSNKAAVTERLWQAHPHGTQDIEIIPICDDNTRKRSGIGARKPASRLLGAIKEAA